MNIKTPIIVCLFVFLYGCDNTPKEETRTVDWYKEHKAERITKLAECRNNPGELSATPNCINAQKAASSVTWGKRGSTKLTPLTADQINKRK